MASKFQKVRSITSAVLKLKPGQPRYIFAMGAAFLGKKIDDKKEPATLLPAVDMETGEEGVLILTTVMKKELLEAYPGDSYVRKGFEIAITKAADAAAGIKYNHVSLAEVAVPEDFTPPSYAPASAPALAAETKTAKQR